MFGDYVKMGIKAALIVVITVAVLVLFNSITIPNLDLSQVSTYLNVAYSVGVHYIPGFVIIWGLGLAVIGLDLAVMLFNLAMIAVRWVMKVAE